MKYIYFSGGADEHPSLARWLSLLPELEQLYVVGPCTSFHRPPTVRGEAPVTVESIPASRLDALDASQYTAIVASPYWIQIVNRFRPRFKVAVLNRCPQGEPADVWNEFADQLASYADLVACMAERTYLEQCLRRSRVVYLCSDAPQKEYEELWKESVLSMLQERSCDSLMLRQWALREEYYRRLNEIFPQHETICYLLASYLYLQGKDEAESFVLASFELMLLGEQLDCLRSHYRFLSAIEAKRGNLDKAVSIYEVTAVTEAEKADLRAMRSWLAEGNEWFVKAEIYRVNEDYRSAMALLRDQQSIEGKRLLLKNLEHTRSFHEIGRIIEPQRSELCPDESSYYLIRGIVKAGEGFLHEAVHAILRSSQQKISSLNYITTMMKLDRGLRQLLRGAGDEAG